MRDIVGGSEGWRARFANRLTNTTILNAFLMTPDRMREYIAFLNIKRPKLIVAYVDSLYELARFAERQGLPVLPQDVVITSAGTLYPFMREKIEEVFQCSVFNRYGSREVGDIACERSECKGLWVGPWGNYIEIVDGKGNRVPDGSEGEILVTSLTNFAMPVVRYRIGDCGALSSRKGSDRCYGQVLEGVLGRTDDMFRAENGALIHGGYFMVMLFFRDWIRKYQVVQKSFSNIVFRIVRSESDYQQAELDEIVAKTKQVMGGDCEVTFEFVNEILPSGSGKYRYIISEISA
jgi:phenylacetate-CoA ligase